MIIDRIISLDDDLIILNKPSGLLSVPGLNNKDSAFGQLEKEFGELHIIHRLDQDTSGIILYARHKKALTAVQQQFEKQTTHKIYEALVIGNPKGNQGCINMPIKVDWPNRPLQKIDHIEGRYALTRWRKAAPEEQNVAGFTRMKLFPKTGRSHQLRIHMQQIGHPIQGDPFYSKDFDREKTPRMALHARELVFYHPGTGERLIIESAPEF